MNLPRGIWYEKKKSRYRLRIQKDKTIMHLSYHRTLESAISILELYRESRVTKDKLKTIISQTKLYYKTARNNRYT